MHRSQDDFLRRTMIADAAISGTSMAILIVAAPILAATLGIPEAVLRGLGILFAPFVALLVWQVRAPSAPGALLVIVLNGLWVCASVAVLLLDVWQPTASGAAVIIVQALVVLALAEAQIIGRRRWPRQAT